MRRTPAHAVDRPGLRAQLDGGLGAPLSLVVAPAGAGKTVLLSQWVNSHPELAVAWLDISPASRDPLVFSRQFAEAVAAAIPRFHRPTAPVVSAEDRWGERYLEELAVALEDAGPLVVVFDDLDRLTGNPLLTDVWRLVDMLPPGVHFVFSSRTDLQLGWSRQRLHFGLVELRQEELAFDEATTAAVLAQITGKFVDESTAAAVNANTEGWAVGVQLTALTMRAAGDPGAVVQTMSGTDRLVMDYLSQEVLEALEPDRRAALMKLAVLDEACSSLAEAVTGMDGARLLSDLEHDSMFIVPVVDRPGWYRFHRLFRDLLLLRLRAHDRRAEIAALTSASRWHLAEGEAEQAIEYLIRARSWDAVLTLIFGVGREFYEGDRMATIARWLALVPPQIREANVDADLLLAMAEAMSGQTTQAIDSLRMMAGSDRLTEGRRLIALAYLAGCVQYHPEPELFAQAAREALAALAEHPDVEIPDLMGLTSRLHLTVVAELALGRALFYLSDLPGAQASFEAALKSSGSAYRPYRVHALGSLALADAVDGRLVEATEHADEALALAAESGLIAHASPADAYLARAVIAVQHGEPDAGALALHEGALRAASNDRTQLLWVAWLVSTIIEQEEGHPDHHEPSGPRPQFVRTTTAALTMRRARLRGTPMPPPAPPRLWSQVAFEEVAGLLTAGRCAEARSRLADAVHDDRAFGPRSHVEHEIVLGWLCAVEGRTGPSREHLQESLRLAEPEWLIDPFIRAGPLVADLIEELPGAGGAFRRLAVRRARAAAFPREHQHDGLTPRELELVAYLPSRLTIADIAERCFVSTNTVKTHLGHIYRKLGVQGRDAAVDRANELGLIDAHEVTRPV